jgi:replicative DNA helicase Mcm
MDIIVPFYQTDDEEQRNAIARGVLDAAQGSVEPEVSKDMLRAYIAYARTFEPDLTDEARAALEEAFDDLQPNTSGDERVTFGARQLESLVRLSEASARLRLSETVDTADVERARKLMETWMSLLMTDENGNWDIDVVKNLAAAKRKPKNEFWRAMNALEEKYGDEVPRDEVVDLMVDRISDEDRRGVQNIINGVTGSGEAEYNKEEGVLRDTR